MDGIYKKEKNKHISNNYYYLYVIATSMLMLTGCARQYRGQAKEQIYVSEVSKAATMELVEDVLAQLHFTVEKVDPRNGLIRTRPLPGAQFFEFWRGDNVGLDNNLQANLHTLRRTVKLDISEQGEKVCVRCNVNVQRLSLPEREITSSGRAYDMFSRSSPSLQTFALNPEQEKAMDWINIGEDVPLATEILRRIQERILDHRIKQQQLMRNET